MKRWVLSAAGETRDGNVGLLWKGGRVPMILIKVICCV